MTILDSIKSKLKADLAPDFIDVLNESHQHNVPENSETHFKVVCVSIGFEGISKVKRHQRVYGILSEELSGSVHALALHLYSPKEWSALSSAPASPECMGGSKP